MRFSIAEPTMEVYPVRLNRINGLVMHTGFMTYALVMVVCLVGVAILAPPLFQQILDAIAKLLRAVRGG